MYPKTQILPSRICWIEQLNLTACLFGLSEEIRYTPRVDSSQPSEQNIDHKKFLVWCRDLRVSTTQEP